MPILTSAFRRAVCAAAFVLPFAGAVLHGQAPRQRIFAVPSRDEARFDLPNSRGDHPANAELLGDLPGETVLQSMSLVLKPSAAQEADLETLLANQQDPTSADYHRWLTPEEYGERFGAAENDLAILRNWLQARGFTVDAVARSRNRILFSGTASAAATAFGVSMRRYRRGEQTFFENSDSVQLPVSLASVVGGVSGLSSYRLAAPQRALPAATAAVTATPAYTTSAGTQYLVPWDFRQIYGMNSLINSGFDGSGIKIGVIGQSAVDGTQLTYFQQKTGQTAKLPTMVLVPNTGSSTKVSGDEGESELDLEYAGGSAPGASIQFIYTGCSPTVTSPGCNNNGVFDALAYAVTNNLAPILTLSYSGCESSNANYANSVLEPILRQANTQGQTIMVSSGDAGAASCESSQTAKVATRGLAVSYPASSPYVTAVGGTTLNDPSQIVNPTYWSMTNNAFLGSALSYIPETAWNDSSTQGYLSASGGGVSKVFTKPTWQAGTGVPTDGSRDVPDVAFPAGVYKHAYAVCGEGALCLSGSNGFVFSGSGKDGGGVGGTSASAPNFAAMLAVIEQANGGAALGNVNGSLYTLAEGTSASSIFHDITSGDNKVNCTTGTTDCTTGTFGYSAGTGYDLVTGLGSISAPDLRTGLAAYAATTAQLQLAVSASTPSIGTPVTFTASLKGNGSTPTGTVTFSVDGTTVGNAVTIASGTATYTYSGFTTTGSHTIKAAYSGDSTFGSTTSSVTITATVARPAISLAISPSSPTANTPLTFTITVTGAIGTPTGQITLSEVSIGTVLVNLTNGLGVYTYTYATAGTRTFQAVYTGDARYGTASTSATVVVTAPTQTLTPTITITSATQPLAAGNTTTLKTTVTGSGPTPTGTLIYSFDGVPAGGGSSLQNGSGTRTYDGSMSVGNHTVTVTYSGDNYYLPGSASTTITITPPGITMSLSPTTITATYGSTASTTVTLTSTNNYGGPLGFSLRLVSSTGATFAGCYRASPSAPAPTPGTPATSTLTIATAASSCTSSGMVPLVAATTSAASQQAPVLPRRSGLAIAAASLLGCFVFRRRLSYAAMCLLCASTLAFGLAGCGSGGSSASSGTTSGSGGGTTTVTTGANSGTYVIAVTASSSSITTATATANLTLVVQ